MKLARLFAVALPVAAVALSSRASFGDTTSSSGSGGSGGSGSTIQGVNCDTAGALTITAVASSTTRMSTQNPDTVSFDDCTQGKTLTLSYAYTGTTLSRVEVYAFVPGQGFNDCLLAASHGTPACIRLRSVTEMKGGDLVLSDAALASALTNNGCTDTSGDGSPSTVTVYILGDPNTDNTPDACTYAAVVDLLGPSAPTGTTAGVEDVSLDITYSSTDPDAASFNIYCDAGGKPEGQGTTSSSAGSGGAGGASGAGGGGVGGAGGAGGGNGGAGGGTGGATSSTVATTGGGNSLLPGCSKSHVLVAGSTPDPMYLVSNDVGTSVTVSRVLHQKMKNGTEYACAVAALDNVGNIGRLSNVACGIPRRTDDFFGTYRGDSGQAGGGLCAMGRGSSAFAATSALVGFSLLAFAGRRRRRPRAKR